MPPSRFTPPQSVATAAGPDLAEAVRKAARRIIPFLLLLYVLAFLDRVNLGYAKQALLRDNGWGETAYAFGAGIFFAGYALFEVPSTLMMRRLGARIWLCRIMVSWGVVSAAMMFVRSEWAFYTLRFLLGVAEAGFFPGIILYLAAWFPEEDRGRVLGLFYFGAPIAQILGGPLSELLLGLDGIAGHKGWQWLFLVEGLLAVAAGFAALGCLDNRPEDAGWLSENERRALRAASRSQEKDPVKPGSAALIAAVGQPRVLYLCLIYGLIQMSVYGVTFYLPADVARLLHQETGLSVGLVSAIPWACALAAAYLVPRLARGAAHRQRIAALCLVASAAGIAASSAGDSGVALAGLCVAAAGFIGAQPVFWTFPAAELSGLSAAGGIALINSVGALGGFLAPNVRAWAETLSGSSRAGALALTATTLLGALLLARLASPPNRISSQTG